MIAIIDFGSQYTQLIARRIRELGVYAEIFPYSISKEELLNISKEKVEGIVFSGGPASVLDEDSPKVSLDFVKSFDVPILGICYGMQLLSYLNGGKLEKSLFREYGYT